jgi:hypothetical protein
MSRPKDQKCVKRIRRTVCDWNKPILNQQDRDSVRDFLKCFGGEKY